MSGTSNTWLGDPRLAAHALSPAPAWLWSSDATRLLWANSGGATILRADTPAALEALRFEPNQSPASQIARLAATLPAGATPRLERLRGFGGRLGGPLTCLCSRIALADQTPGILVVATERPGPGLSLDERLRWLIGDADAPVAAFSSEGDLLLASPDAEGQLSGAATLAALGAGELAQRALRDGSAEAEISAGPARLDRLNAGSTQVLLLSLTPEQPAAAAAAEIAAAGPVASESVKRHQPLRFVWRTDADHRFMTEGQEFIELIGGKAALGAPWSEFAARLKLGDGDGVAAALASQETWSGTTVQWPIDGGPEQIPVELSGLPVFDREQNFQGYRGFGICREPQRLLDIKRQRADAQAAAEAAAELREQETAQAEAVAKAAATTAAAAAAEAAKAASATAEQEQANGTKAPGETANVVQFPSAAPEPSPGLDAREQKAFSELARELTDRLKTTNGKPLSEDDFGPERPEPIGEPANAATPVVRKDTVARDAQKERPILDRLPIGILVYRLNDLLYANRAFLDWTDYPTLEALSAAGGLDSLFIESNAPAAANNKAKNSAPVLTITTPGGKKMPVEGRLFPAMWNGENALVLMLNITKTADKTAGLTTRQIENENRELKAVLDTATDGVLMIDRAGRVLSANRSAEALFGYDGADFRKLTFGDLFAPESRRTVLDYLDQLAQENAISLLNEGKEVIGRVRQGGLVPLYMTIGRVGENSEKFCVVFRDITAWKKSEEELINARRHAEGASSAKSEFLAKISHEIRTPLNAIIGFSEVMIDERFGPVGNERYRQYLRDIHSSGGHLTSLLNDLLDLSKIEAGKLDLAFTGINLNDIAQQCVAILQEQANRERVIIRTSLPPTLPRIVADARSVRQIMLNLLSNSIKFAGAGGQVIVSTALTDRNQIALRVRDTGAGMSAQELQAALEPFRQLATAARWGSSGTGLGLPITKALAEANHATFTITSAVDDGTLVEVAFPAPRVLAK
ncbi:MAG: PAS domain-containing sensor histidine kinase [Pseudolabrys sp.]